MTDGRLAQYNVLILDDTTGPGTWGHIALLQLVASEYVAIHTGTVEDALAALGEEYYDILIVDIHLGGKEDGIMFQKRIREIGYNQPVLFVTGKERALNEPIKSYIDIFARGPVLFYNKNSREISFLDMVRQTIRLADPIRRSLFIMRTSGLKDREFRIGDNVYTVEQLLMPSEETETFIISLRESLQQLLLEYLPT